MYDIKIPVCACVKKTIIKEVENWVQFREGRSKPYFLYFTFHCRLPSYLTVPRDAPFSL